MNEPTDDERKQLDDIMAEAYGYWPPARSRILERFRRSDEPKWEYGIQAEYLCGDIGVRMWGSNRERLESQMYRWPGSTLVKRVIAGPWVPITQEGAGHEGDA